MHKFESGLATSCAALQTFAAELLLLLPLLVLD
jgi:hypothetical protein